LQVFKSHDPKIEVLGQNIFAIIDAMGAFKKTAIKILEDQGIVNVDPNKWYSQQAFLNAFKIIYEKLGKATMKVIGMKVPQKAALPPGINSTEDMLNLLNKAYHMNHRGGDPSFFKFEKTGNNKGTVICENPYPCVFDEGLIQAFMEAFRTPGSVPIVKHSDEGCRMDGKSQCKFHLEW